MLASMPVPVKDWPARSRMWRAAKCVLAPQSRQITASSANASLSARMTIWGRSGVRAEDSTRSSSAFQSRSCAWAAVRNERSGFAGSIGSNALNVSLVSPTKPTSTG